MRSARENDSRTLQALNGARPFGGVARGIGHADCTPAET